VWIKWVNEIRLAVRGSVFAVRGSRFAVRGSRFGREVKSGIFKAPATGNLNCQLETEKETPATVIHRRRLSESRIANRES